ncbi:leukocyte receptor cluster member 9 [Antechinus flavipes]|uniref:leukocyte receptor cluster member 9 n=1 Tax=Antechinus flavipes TaxID=38775 RepID=UPI002236BB06|nr:leukocyte receptor cluster member 9 [Antechinus flavipes]
MTDNPTPTPAEKGNQPGWAAPLRGPLKSLTPGTRTPKGRDRRGRKSRGHLGPGSQPLALGGGGGGGGMEEGGGPEPVCRFYLEGRCHFGARCRLPHPGAEGRARAEPLPGPASSPEGKKPSMKTAQAVIDRIRWDPHLEPADFSVGYLDRFRGVQEEPFTAFCWDEDLAALGPGVLAVPQHRIRYFRHRGRLVWDRASRTDLVFGSAAGRGTTILDGLATAGGPGAGEEGGPGTEPEGRGEEGGPGTEAGAGEEDGKPGTEAKGRSEGRPGAPEEDRGPEREPKGRGEEGGPGTSGRSDSGRGAAEGLRPTHFVALPITDPQLRAAVVGAQAGLAGAVSPGALHLTLVLLRLAGPGEVAAAAGALRQLVRGPGFHCPRALHFQNLACLDHRLIYSLPSPGLEGLAQALARGLEAEGLQVLEAAGRELGPHLTLAKLPRGSPGRLSLPEAPGDAELGSQSVEELQLCSVGGAQGPEAGSSVLAQVPLVPSTLPGALH